MTALGPTTFAVLLWTAVLGVAATFVYEVYVLARDYRDGLR